jgi:hypothetical protein
MKTTGSRKQKKRQRGFSLLIVIVLVIVLGLTGMQLLRMIQIDLTVIGQDRRGTQSRDDAEGGTMEITNDVQLATVLPDVSQPLNCLMVQLNPGGFTCGGTTWTFNYPNPSPFNDVNMGTAYTSTIRYLRMVPLTDSDFSWTSAVIYEIDTIGTMNGNVSSEVKSEVYKVVSNETKQIIPNKHYR